YYRFNTRRTVEGVFMRASLIPRQIKMVEKEPYYLTFAIPAFLIGYCYERLVNRFNCLAGFRSNILGYVGKPLDRQAFNQPLIINFKNDANVSVRSNRS